MQKLKEEAPTCKGRKSWVINQSDRNQEMGPLLNRNWGIRPRISLLLRDDLATVRKNQDEIWWILDAKIRKIKAPDGLHVFMICFGDFSVSENFCFCFCFCSLYQPGKAIKASECLAISAFLWCISATAFTSPTVTPVSWKRAPNHRFYIYFFIFWKENLETCREKYRVGVLCSEAMMRVAGMVDLNQDLQLHLVIHTVPSG